MKCLGIDQSYTSTGFCVIKDDVVIDFGKIKSEGDDVYSRSLFVALKIYEKMNEYDINTVCVEGLAFGIRGDATRDLAGLLFTIINIVKHKNPSAQFVVVPPTTLKKFATGSGKSDKVAMIESLPTDVRQSFLDAGYKKTTGLTDITDAYWLANYKQT
jgi:Holliday junction resolvasome RuvABC endonuclease subunit